MVKPAPAEAIVEARRSLDRSVALAYAAEIEPFFDPVYLTRARAVCAVVDGFFRVVFTHDGQRKHSAPAGPRCRWPRAAIAVANVLNEPLERALGVTVKHWPDYTPAQLDALRELPSERLAAEHDQTIARDE